MFNPLLSLWPCELSCFSLKSCGGPGTLYRKVEHLLIAVPGIIALAWVILILFVRALYYEFG